MQRVLVSASSRPLQIHGHSQDFRTIGCAPWKRIKIAIASWSLVLVSLLRKPAEETAAPSKPAAPPTSNGSNGSIAVPRCTTRFKTQVPAEQLCSVSP
eukprot:2730111-Amphidinium_carterae.1